jgi:hypothetical protein
MKTAAVPATNIQLCKGKLSQLSYLDLLLRFSAPLLKKTTSVVFSTEPGRGNLAEDLNAGR